MSFLVNIEPPKVPMERPKEVTVKKVSNGYIVETSHSTEQAVYNSIDEMINDLKTFFEGGQK